MNVAAGPDLAAAVSNAGGLGVIGGLGYTYVVALLYGISPPLTFQPEALAWDYQRPQVVAQLA